MVRSVSPWGNPYNWVETAPQPLPSSRECCRGNSSGPPRPLPFAREGSAKPTYSSRLVLAGVESSYAVSYLQTRGNPVAWASRCHPSQGGSASVATQKKPPTCNNFTAKLSREIHAALLFPVYPRAKTSPLTSCPVSPSPARERGHRWRGAKHGWLASRIACSCYLKRLCS